MPRDTTTNLMQSIAPDRNCDRCFGKLKDNRILMHNQTYCPRCAEEIRKKFREPSPRDIEYAQWLRRHKLKD